MKFNLDNTCMRSLPIRGVQSGIRVSKDVFCNKQYYH